MHRRTWVNGRRGFGALVVSGLLSAFLAGAPAARAETPQQQREAIQKQQAAVAAELDALKATDAQVEQALADLNANVATQETLLADAQRAASQAKVAAENARAAETAAEAKVAELAAALRELAVAAYIDPASQGDPGFTFFSADSANDAVFKTALVELRAGTNVDLTDRWEAAQEDLETAREAADSALAKANDTAAQAQARVDEVRKAREQQQQFGAQIDARINNALSEAAGLAELDKKLAAQIAAAAAAQAAASSHSGTGGTPIGPIALKTVHGITVAASIADQLNAMWEAAYADGFTLSGGGYRSQESQIALRKAHCGTSYYAIWQMPASQCHPPTAPPGSSMHEYGLAIDFTWNGSLITSHSNPAYQWLDAHASQYGFYNLPSEPWHWSTNGH